MDSVGVSDESLGVETDQRHKMGCSSFSKGEVAIGYHKCRVLGTQHQASSCSQNIPLGRHIDFN